VTDRFGLWGPPGTSNVAWVSATAWKRTKAGKMKMWHFSGIKFAVGLAEETYKPLPLHEIRRKRAGRPNFSLNAQEENHPFSHCRYECSFRSPLTAWGNFDNFLAYAAQLNPYLPAAWIPMVGWGVTLAEAACGLALIVGFQTRKVAVGSGL